MKYRNLIYLWIILLSPVFSSGQTGFSTDAYYTFLKQSKDLDFPELSQRHPKASPVYSGKENPINFSDVLYLDTVVKKLGLSNSELELLKKNEFVVSGNNEKEAMTWALQDVYNLDLPVFISTDLVLHALHLSYDRILMDMELDILEPNLINALQGLYDHFDSLESKYVMDSCMLDPLNDVDLFVTTALSLIHGKKYSPYRISQEKFDEIWGAILDERMKAVELFTNDRTRNIDFSQFTVRGHYATEIYYTQDGPKTLGNYFKAMMWLGRIDFFLTPPPENPSELPWTREEIRRMNLGALLLQELNTMSDVQKYIDKNDEMIDFFVGKSDNLTPAEYQRILSSLNISLATDLKDDTLYDRYQETLLNSQNAGQKILSSILMMDPYSDAPGLLPVSYRLMGQRFIIDSYVFSNLVFDRIIYKGEKIWRPLPDPLDALFVLGNDDALPLLSEELASYHYGTQLDALRYLVDSYDDEFWDATLYNTWLQAIRQLNPVEDQKQYPFFMQTAAWHQEKINTQLASWAQLRHDNLLYAKQSYTGGASCIYPHSFVEPYPDFYRQIGLFANRANEYFNGIMGNNWRIQSIKNYFSDLEEVMTKLEELAKKELLTVEFTEAENSWLGKMLYDGGAMCGEPPYTGWIGKMFYDQMKATEPDYVIADIHTQPTDQGGNFVGHVLHVGVGNVNLGVFIARSPSAGFEQMAYVGPVMSYYEEITSDFERLTDQDWESVVTSGKLPERPDWVNSYMSGPDGDHLLPGRQIPGVMHSTSSIPPPGDSQTGSLKVFPNPVQGQAYFSYTLESASWIRLEILDILGKPVDIIQEQFNEAGEHVISWSPDKRLNGFYTAVIFSNNIKQGIARLAIH